MKYNQAIERVIKSVHNINGPGKFSNQSLLIYATTKVKIVAHV